ncbi:uncharacterized protein isoform X3 [Rhodnius prolixus]
MFWNLWCERIKFLNPEDESPVSTYSETSVGSTSVSTSTAYGNKAKKDLWDTKDLFLGENFGQGESTVERKPKGQSHIPREKDIGDKRISGRSQVCLVNRFGHGISENCSTNLFLPVQIYVTPNFDQATQNSADLERENTTMVMKNSFAREPIIFWEGQRPQVKHRRRYGIIPQGFLFCGLGKINIDRPQLLSLQLKRCCSEVYISNYDSEIEDISRLPKRLLTSSLSCDCLIENQRNNEADHDPVRGSSKYNFYQGEYFFWTPNFWYRPMNARYGYKKLMQHLENLQQYHKIEDMKQRNLLLWNMVPLKSESEEDTTQPNFRKSSFLSSLINATTLDLIITSWDFDSTMFSYQLTAIDRDLFIQIPVRELSVLLSERNTSNTPHIKAMLAFAERISNLIATEIVRLDSIKLRAKLITKFINVARRLEHLQNMHTTKTVLLGLQSPAIYRLKKTWNYVRNHHNNKYRRLYEMMKTHKEFRSRDYCFFFGSITETRPYLPALMHIITALFGKLPPNLFQLMSASTSQEQLSNKALYKFGRNIPLWPSISEDSNISETTTIARSDKSISSSGTSLNEGTIINKLKSRTQQQALSLPSTNSHLEKMMMCLEEWQRVANQFGLLENPVLKEFLLKSKYMEQDVCFLMSLKMEPPDPSSKQLLPDMHKIGN